MNAPLPLQRLKRAGELIQALEQIETELYAIFGFETGNGTGKASKSQPADKPKKRGMSAAGRARIAAAQRARWAKQKGSAAEKPGKSKVKKAKRELSPEARAKIAAAQKKRWAKHRAGK